MKFVFDKRISPKTLIIAQYPISANLSIQSYNYVIVVLKYSHL